jgi:hypothetical protein
VPNPMNAAKLRDPLYIYYEIYNLGLSDRGVTNYTVHFTLRQTDTGRNLFKKMAGLIGGAGKYRVSIQNDRSGRTRTAADYTGFDVRQAAPGMYQLKLTVKDRNANREASSSTVIRLE